MSCVSSLSLDVNHKKGKQKKEVVLNKPKFERLSRLLFRRWIRFEMKSLAIDINIEFVCVCGNFPGEKEKKTTGLLGW